MVKKINIKDESIPEMIEVYGVNYSENVYNPDTGEDDLTNPESKASFANRMLTVHLRQAISNKVNKHRREQAAISISDSDITMD